MEKSPTSQDLTQLSSYEEAEDSDDDVCEHCQRAAMEKVDALFQEIQASEPGGEKGKAKSKLKPLWRNFKQRESGRVVERPSQNTVLEPRQQCRHSKETTTVESRQGSLESPAGANEGDQVVPSGGSTLLLEQDNQPPSKSDTSPRVRKKTPGMDRRQKPRSRSSHSDCALL